jgi:outer membrane protein assembly factor BamB
MVGEGYTRRELLRAISVATATAATTTPTAARSTTPAPTSAAPVDWPTYQHDPRNTGHAPNTYGPTPPIADGWRFRTGWTVESSPAVVDGTVYVGSNDQNVYALAAEDGSEQWRFQTDGSVVSSPAVVDGTVYVGSSDRSVYALESGAAPAAATVEGFSPPETVTVGAPLSVSATVTNTGGQTARWTIT